MSDAGVADLPTGATGSTAAGSAGATGGVAAGVLAAALAATTGPGPVLVVGRGVRADDLRRAARAAGREAPLAADVVAAARVAAADAPALTLVTTPHLADTFTADGPTPAERDAALTALLDASTVLAVDPGTGDAAADDRADLVARLAGHGWSARAGRSAGGPVLLDRAPREVVDLVAAYERELAAAQRQVAEVREALEVERHQALRTRDHLVGLEATTGTARRTLATLSAAHDRLVHDNAHLRAEVDAVRASATWRVGDLVLKVPRRALGR